MATLPEITPEEMAEYRTTARQRSAQEQKYAAQRLERAWEFARQAAGLLKEKFGATRVMVFGSLVHEGCFTRWSDVDIAAWGIHPEDTLRAIGAAMDVDSDIEINLVDVATCRPELLAAIEREGVKL